jgi:hypothetical protein
MCSLSLATGRSLAGIVCMWYAVSLPHSGMQPLKCAIVGMSSQYQPHSASCVTRPLHQRHAHSLSRHRWDQYDTYVLATLVERPGIIA